MLVRRLCLHQHLSTRGQEAPDPAQERHGIPTDADAAVEHEGPIPLRTSGDGIEDGVEDDGSLTALRDFDKVGGEVHAQGIDPPLGKCLDMATRTAADVEHGSPDPFEDPQVHVIGVAQPTIHLELAEVPIGELHPGVWGDNGTMQRRPAASGPT